MEDRRALSRAAGSDRENSGHHHLLIDTDLPPLDQPIPNDFNHLHFGGGQTEAEVTLKHGEHTLQLLFGDKDHIPHTPPVLSQRIRVRVVDPSIRKPAPADARVYFVGLQDGSVLPQTTILRLANMGVLAGIDKPNTATIILDRRQAAPLDLPIPTTSITAFGAGQTAQP
jgi:hypothetical protein